MEERFDTVADCCADEMDADGFVVAANGSADGLIAADLAESADGLKAVDLAESADGLKAVDLAESADGLKAVDLAESADGLKAADLAESADVEVPDVAGEEEEESAAAEGGGAPHPLSQPAAPPLPQREVMVMAELVIELVPLVLPVTVLLFGWFGGAWLE